MVEFTELKTIRARYNNVTAKGEKHNLKKLNIIVTIFLKELLKQCKIYYVKNRKLKPP